MSDDCGSDVEFSDDEGPVTWSKAKSFKIRFGKHKGKTMEAMIKTKNRRAYLVYLMDWKDIRPETRDNIDITLAEYERLKKTLAKPTSLPVLSSAEKEPLPPQ